MMDDLTRNVLEKRDNIENQRNRELNSNREEYIKQLQQENQALKNTIKRCYTPEEIDFEIMPVKVELQAEKDINNSLHKTIDKLRVNLYEIQQENKQLKEKYLNAVADYEYEKSKNQRAIEYIRKSDALYEFKVDTSVNAIPNSIIVDDYKTRKELIETLQTLKVLDEYKDES